MNLNGVEEYCILKIPEHFPNYREHSDLDILCKDRVRMMDYTTLFLKQYNNIDVKIHYPENGKHLHVDVYRKGKSLNFKFDFIDSFSIYKKSTLNPGFEESVFNGKRIRKNVCVPSIPHEMLIRMLEYIEYKDTRPDKAKHLSYVQENQKYSAEFNRLWNLFVTDNDKKRNAAKPEPIVIVSLAGGLGNQMFQYAAALALGQQWQCTVKVDIRHYNYSDNRTYQLDRYKLAPTMADMEELALFETPSASWQNRLHRFIPRYKPTYTIYHQPGFDYDPNLIKLRPPLLLRSGYFQSEKFFLSCEQTIRAAFQLKHPLALQEQMHWKAIKAARWPVALHVRRGDYLRPDQKALHPVCTRAYYQKAIDITNNLSGQKATYFVFSDDIVAARSILSFIPDATFVTPHQDKPQVDMALMAACRDMIIANSSFSWWGAWLNSHPDKHVIAPRLWFQRERHIDTRDLIPPQWTSLE